jgi:hypothetical protein
MADDAGEEKWLTAFVSSSAGEGRARRRLPGETASFVG